MTQNKGADQMFGEWRDFLFLSYIQLNYKGRLGVN